MRALIVDSSKSTRKIYAQILEYYQIEVVEADNATTALQLLQSYSVDLLMFSYELPDMSGLDFFEAARSQYQHQGIVSMLITSRTDAKLLNKALAMGVTACFPKNHLLRIEHFIANFAQVLNLHIDGKVLLVEDSPSASNVYCKILKKMGLRYKTYTTAKEAIVRIESGKPFDLVITDFNLGGSADAFSIINAVRSLSGPWKNTPILVTSALDSPARRAQLLLNGANEFFSKDGLLEELMIRVKSLIHQHKMLQRIESQYQNMYEAVNRDALTNLFNRHRLNAIEDQIFTAAKQSAKSSCIILFDTDNFKKINDTWGHHIGDLVLKEIASQLPIFFKETQHIFRVGGDEFLVVLENTSVTEAEKLLNTFVLGLAEQKVENIPIKVSAGIADIGEEADFTSAYITADRSMYKAKKMNRNSVYISG